MSLAPFPALVALLPAMIGPLPLERGSDALLLALCGGGHVAISLNEGDGPAPLPATTPCCAKGCRTGDKAGKRRNTLRDN